MPVRCIGSDPSFLQVSIVHWKISVMSYLCTLEITYTTVQKGLETLSRQLGCT